MIKKEMSRKSEIRKLIEKMGMIAIILPGLVITSFGALGTTTAHALQAQEGQTCAVITRTSGATTTLTAGFTEVNPVGAPGSLAANLYSGSAFTGAKVTQPVIPPWIDPSIDPNFIGSGAVWVSSTAGWPGSDGNAADTVNTEGSPTENQWRLFRESFTLPVGATITSAQIIYSADNATAVYLNGNGTAITTTNSTSSDSASADADVVLAEEVYGTTPSVGSSNFANAFSAAFSPVVGVNTLDFVVRNWSTGANINPTGLIYKVAVNYCVPTTPTPTPTLTTGQIAGDVVDIALVVTSIDAIDTSAIANGTFSDGWKYVFHITAPMSEQNISMKFDNWQKNGGGGRIPVNNNMRISSAEADNASSTILLTAADTYAVPALHMTGDLNPTMPGRQVEITVEVAIPSVILDGAYTTNYGVQSTR